MQPSPNNLFNNYQRNLLRSSNATLPIIALPSFSNCKENFIRMPTNNNNKIKIPSSSPSSPVQISTDFRMTQIRSHIRAITRSNALSMPKSSFNDQTMSFRSNKQQPQQNTRYLYVLNTPKSPYRIKSARIPNNYIPQQQTNLVRSNNEYGHFLAYLRRQSLARLRRKQQEEEGNIDHIETTITLNLNKRNSPQPFQSPSNYSVNSLTLDTSSMPLISMTAKRARGRPISSSLQHPVQRIKSSYRLNAFQQTVPPKPKTSVNNQLCVPSLLMTPRNSVEDDSTISPITKRYELHMNNDMLNYCYISDQSGIKYHGEMLSTAV